MYIYNTYYSDVFLINYISIFNYALKFCFWFRLNNTFSSHFSDEKKVTRTFISDKYWSDLVVPRRVKCVCVGYTPTYRRRPHNIRIKHFADARNTKLIVRAAIVSTDLLCYYYS